MIFCVEWIKIDAKIFTLSEIDKIPEKYRKSCVADQRPRDEDGGAAAYTTRTHDIPRKEDVLLIDMEVETVQN